MNAEPAVRGRVDAKNAFASQPYLWPTGLVVDVLADSVNKELRILYLTIG